MEIVIEKDDPHLRVKKVLSILMIAGMLTSILGLGIMKQIKTKSNFELPPVSELAIIQGNTLLPVSNPIAPVKPPKKIKMVVTAYSSTIWETDDTPFITASGKAVEEGIVANNMLPFGTEIKIPEIYGEKIFVVEDRMHWTKGRYHLDIWFPEHLQAKNFGAKKTYVEILES